MSDKLSVYFSTRAKSCALVGKKEFIKGAIEKYKNVTEYNKFFIVELPIKQGQTEDDLPLEKTWKFWRAMVREYAEKISIDNIKKYLSLKEPLSLEAEDELNSIQEIYEFFSNDYLWEKEVEQYFQSLKDEFGMTEAGLEKELVENLLSRCINETMSWVSYVFHQWDGKDVDGLNSRIHEKRHSGQIAEDIDLVKKIMFLTEKETPQECIPLFDNETKFPEKKLKVRGLISDIEYNVFAKRLSETENEIKCMAVKELRYLAVEKYQRKAAGYLEDLRDAYKALGINIRLIISGFEQTETIYPETDNIGTLFTELFSLSQKSIITPPEVIMLVSEKDPKLLAHHLAVGSDFCAAYPVVSSIE